MRLEAQLRGGFFPAPHEAVAHAATFLRPPGDQHFAILDPCAGEGAAISQLGSLLGCPHEMTYAIELDDGRADKLRAALPAAHVLAPASFFGCRASCNSFSFIWLNPPFDDAYGGQRLEGEFLRRATEWLMPGGVLALICPESVADGSGELSRHFATYYENCSIAPFPLLHRPFQEVIVFGVKRALSQADKKWDTPWEKDSQGVVYSIPAGPGPRMFQKVAPTENELQDMLAKSPLRAHLTTLPEAPLPSPPLALGMGHVALLLASGHLDGVVAPEGRPPHVVRGTSRKREFTAEESETENEDGTTTTKTVIAERIDLVVRTVDLTGKIQTFMETDAPQSEPASS